MVLSTSTVFLGSFPAVCMLVLTVIGLKVRVPEDVAGALQHFAAGLLLSAIASELLPELLQAQGFRENCGVTIGFFLGMAVLIVLGILLPEDHSHDDDDDDGDEHDDTPLPLRRQSSLLLESIRSFRRSQSLPSSARNINQNWRDLCEESMFSERGEDHCVQENQPLMSSSLRSNHSQDLPTKPFPSAFLAAVVVDSFMDGFLIGIASAAGPSATIMMAGSLSVEMSFVGLTLATALHGLPQGAAMGAALAGPITLVVGAWIGHALGDLLMHHPAWYAGMMGFGTSALLFMVAEELLLEAHEKGEHIWWVDLQLYTGFYVSFMSTKFIPND